MPELVDTFVVCSACGVVAPANVSIVVDSKRWKCAGCGRFTADNIRLECAMTFDQAKDVAWKMTLSKREAIGAPKI
jgi:CO dehydrogenase/acetyl-CoA synthase beta subunit